MSPKIRDDSYLSPEIQRLHILLVGNTTISGNPSEEVATLHGRKKWGPLSSWRKQYRLYIFEFRDMLRPPKTFHKRTQIDASYKYPDARVPSDR